MAHPKRKQFKSRRDKRRNHLKIKEPLLVKCALTNHKHLNHHAYCYEKNSIKEERLYTAKKNKDPDISIMDFKKIKSLVQFVSESNISEIRIKIGTTKIHIKIRHL